MYRSSDYLTAYDHIEKLLDRRQSTTTVYLSVNAAIATALGILVKDVNLHGLGLSTALVLLLFAGLVATWLWRALLQQYQVLIGWWYARLRELEAEMPDARNLVTQEYEELYAQDPQTRNGEKLSITSIEVRLTWIFTVLYLLFLLGVVGFQIAAFVM